MLKFWIIAVLVLSGCADHGNRALLSSVNHNVYSFQGPINSASYQNIIDILKANVDQLVIINANSNGGYIDGILEAMDAIHNHGQVTWNIKSYDACVSACAVLGMSAKNINGKLNFHSVYTRYNSKSYKLLGNNEEIQNRLIQFGYDAQLVKQFFKSVNIYRSIEFKDGKIIQIN